MGNLSPVFYAVPVEHQPDKPESSPRQIRPKNSLDSPRPKKRQSAFTEPFPTGEWYTLDAVCLMFGCSRRTLWNLLSSRRELFGPRVYRRGYRNRLHRLLSASDVAILRQHFRVAIKVK